MMSMGPTSNEELARAILMECAESLKKSPGDLMQLIAQNMAKGGLPVRVNYMLGGLRALGMANIEVIAGYFEGLRKAVPREEEFIHEQAVGIVYDHIIKMVLGNTQNMLDNLAMAIGLPVKVVFTSSLDESTTVKETSEGNTLH
jgi:hypothetical protein